MRDGHDADFALRARLPRREARLRAVALDAADVRPPNERFKYSNIAFGLLGMVVEAASGTTYHEHVTTEVVQRGWGSHNTGPELRSPSGPATTRSATRHWPTPRPACRSRT